MSLKQLFFYLFLLVLSCKLKDSDKHLFILSGQSNMVRLDTDVSFIPTLEAEFGKENIIIVKDAMGSQSIKRWYKQWKAPNGNTPECTGDLYDRLMLKVIDSIKNQKITSVTFIWMQGERDARMKFAAVYEKSLLGLHKQLSNDINRSDVNFIIGRLSDFDMENKKWPHWTMIRDIQVKDGASNPRFDWIDTNDLNDGFNKKGDPIQNDLHMSVEGYKIMGKRFADKAIELIKTN
ncbi:MAG: sialate O-acetylesterase [Kordia sp.]|uniref:sialate O-acetylesterase n=1 Tax=Kordia sp. TaxID=1965332 RepID=UPI00385BA695